MLLILATDSDKGDLFRGALGAATYHIVPSMYGSHCDRLTHLSLQILKKVELFCPANVFLSDPIDKTRNF